MGSNTAKPQLSTPNRVRLDDPSQFINYAEIKGGLDNFTKTYGAMDPIEIAQMKALRERALNSYGQKAIFDAKNTAAGYGLSPTSIIKAQSDFSNKAIDQMGEIDYDITKTNREIVNRGRQEWLSKLMALSQQVAGNATGRFNQEMGIYNMANENELRRYEIDKANETKWEEILGSIVGSGASLFSAGMGPGWLK